MIASILQLTGAIILGYYVAFRTKVKSREIAHLIIPVKGVRNQKYLELYTETYAFRIGIVFIVMGYLFQIANFDFNYFNSMNTISRLTISLIATLILTYYSKLLAEWMGKRLYNKEGVFNPDESIMVGQIMLDMSDEEKEKCSQ